MGEEGKQMNRREGVSSRKLCFGRRGSARRESSPLPCLPSQATLPWLLQATAELVPRR